jgi:surfactin synthase thioesterase subunit
MYNHNEKPTVYLLPFAGGGASDMQRLRVELQKSYPTYCLELPGRGRRWREPFIINIDDAIDDLYSQICIDREAVIVGHSLGAYLGYKVAHQLSQSIRVQFFALSNISPSAENSIAGNVSLSSSNEKILRLAGNHESLDKLRSHSMELYTLAMAVLRHDLVLSDSFLSCMDKPKLPCDIHLLYGLDECYSEEKLLQWNIFTDKKLKIHTVKGDHFFPQEHPKLTASIICSMLEEVEIYYRDSNQPVEPS